MHLIDYIICTIHSKTGLVGFFHLVEETGLNPGLNRPGRNRFLPPEVEETGRKVEMND